MKAISLFFLGLVFCLGKNDFRKVFLGSAEKREFVFCFSEGFWCAYGKAPFLC